MRHLLRNISVPMLNIPRKESMSDENLGEKRKSGLTGKLCFSHVCCGSKRDVGTILPAQSEGCFSCSALHVHSHSSYHTITLCSLLWHCARAGRGRGSGIMNEALY